MTPLLQEIEDLQAQIQHFEAAIAALKKPGETPTGNSLADVLSARFAKLDSDEERQKSLKTAQTLLLETKEKLESKQTQLKRVRDVLSARKSAMSETGRQINRLSSELKTLLDALKSDEQGISEQWRVVAGNVPMINWKAEIVLPEFQQLTGEGSRYAVAPLGQDLGGL
uniref:Uncharacterized protein n=1 Tax=Oscillatoriales cyanobacterium SpSt-402 TaxID=2282168 RepID=A0A832H2R5_9CYAN